MKCTPSRKTLKYATVLELDVLGHYFSYTLLFSLFAVSREQDTATGKRTGHLSFLQYPATTNSKDCAMFEHLY